MKRTGTDPLFVGAGLLLILAPVLPVATWASARDVGPPWADYLTSWLLGSILVAVFAAAGGRYLKLHQLSLPVVKPAPVVAGLALLAVLASIFVSRYAFAASPQLVDEMAQLFHARVFLSGALAAPVPENPEFFLLPNTFIASGGWISQYPPGGSALLAVGMFLGNPALINPLMAGAGTLLVFVLGRNLFDARVALLGAFLWATSPWVLSMSATFMSHAPATTFALAAWAIVLRKNPPDRIWSMVAGLSLAACAATRPLDAVIAVVPLAIWFFATGRKWRTPIYMLVGGTPVLLIWFWINWRTMGHPLAMAYIQNFGPAHRPGFHVDPFGNAFTLAEGLSNFSSGLRRLNVYLFEWPVPALLPVIAWLVFARNKLLADGVLLAGFLTAPLVYLFYFHSGFYPGPRFYYLGAPFLILATARAFFWLLGVLPNRAAFSGKSALIAASVIVWAWGTFGLVPERFASYRASLANLKLHPERELADMNVERALVLVPETWGSRVMARMWGKTIPSSLAERAYRMLDLCELDSIVSSAAGPQLESILESAVAAGNRAPLVEGAPDPTLRLQSTENLRPECIAELRRDLNGFAVYPPLGWMNDVRRAEGVIFARDLFQFNGPLMRQFQGWPIWRFAPPAGFPDSLPQLERIR